MNKKIVILTGIIIVIIIISLLGSMALFDDKNLDEKNSILKADSYVAEKATSTIKSNKNTSLLQQSLYTDIDSRFSIHLPSGWSLSGKENSTTTITSRFSNASSTMFVSKYPRSKEIEGVIEKLGPGGLLDIIVNNIASGLNQYKLISTQSTNINGTTYRQVISTYVGIKTKKQITQYIYLTLQKDSYYLIGIDVYSDIWDKNKEPILESMNSFKLI